MTQKRFWLVLFGSLAMIPVVVYTVGLLVWNAGTRKASQRPPPMIPPPAATKR